MHIIADILLKGESQTVEFKASFSDEVIITLVAFSNTKGGTVYIGVLDNGKIKGVDIGKETVAQWMNEIKSKTVPAIVPNMDIFVADAKTIVTLTVVEYPVKPLSMKGRYYKREGNANHLMSTFEISNLSLQTRQVSWDSYLYNGATVDDLDIEKVHQFIRKVNEAGRFSLPGGYIEALDKLGMLQNAVPTNAAMVLFSKKDLHYNVHIGRFKTPSLIVADKMISGNLYNVVDEAMQTIIGHLKFAFEINIRNANTQRTEIPEYPLDALRELLLNAIVHRDYQSPTDVQIKIFDNGISFFNPSGLYGDITEEDLKTDNYRASTRNKQIAEAFYLTKDIEKYGSGFIRIRKEIEHYPTMRFNYRDAGYGFFAEFSYVQQKITSKDPEKTVEKTVEKILNLIKENSKITQDDLVEKTGLTRRGVEWNLTSLKKQGILTRVGGRKSGFWQVNEKD